jgi:hypothetical protein
VSAGQLSSDITLDMNTYVVTYSLVIVHVRDFPVMSLRQLGSFLSQVTGYAN